MFGTRLHRLAAILLAVLYGLVGFTGEALHYLVNDPAVLWSGSESVETAGYYHVHGPDHHGHFHRHAHGGSHSHSTHVAVSSAPDAEHDAAITAPLATHESHACPLLALVSTLKLGHGACAAALIDFDLLAARTCEREIVAALDAAFSSYARGPPACLFA